ncbi:hypothetical protein F442_16374 [Phytophthora nicotianae P10297]|uniref:Uncharacterized protein n=2 Tax=Phytophthora nicotianae TaxID=4792 RepID=W2PQL3_PHYN3|nr:hypothetical protein PPTG_23839 [Phytophthora nicotianae INRA-310]ETN03192.1 hypothetical protein PPTG_23839 [Phytophthora nicotianae INRA-310]ETP35444.1 hypothetical protein F442_16374 [Phytophthora nicotianae P10297]
MAFGCFFTWSKTRSKFLYGSEMFVGMPGLPAFRRRINAYKAKSATVNADPVAYCPLNASTRFSRKSSVFGIRSFDKFLRIICCLSGLLSLTVARHSGLLNISSIKTKISST